MGGLSEFCGLGNFAEFDGSANPDELASLFSSAGFDGLGDLSEFDELGKFPEFNGSASPAKLASLLSSAVSVGLPGLPNSANAEGPS
ncbi:hypothetical protein [Cohnella fermenti]|uniref:Uncharacterized protein n=1 Tax=Cohnella fermenti TaxID=2565925 RepID=A0A4S4BSX0_9BACL|nr:hypothetical protein [Cohnella fermenti]THF75861.1 hypothetical protein E6C55_20365 [Cohnella fermenti]